MFVVSNVETLQSRQACFDALKVVFIVSFHHRNILTQYCNVHDIWRGVDDLRNQLFTDDAV
jgi:desulfoferrodoxin (superoxide reductase-like protein)